MARRRWGLAMVLVLGVVGCRRGEETPQAAYVAFTDLVARGDYKRAYGWLSEATRSAMEERAKKLAEQTGGVVAADATALFFSRLRPTPVTEVRVIRQDGATATLSVRAGEITREVQMTKEPSGWKLHLPQLAGSG